MVSRNVSCKADGFYAGQAGGVAFLRSSIYDAARFDNVALRPETKELLKQNARAATGAAKGRP